MIMNGKEIRLDPRNLIMREGFAKELATNDEDLDKTPKIVRRHARVSFQNILLFALKIILRVVKIKLINFFY